MPGHYLDKDILTSPLSASPSLGENHGSYMSANSNPPKNYPRLKITKYVDVVDATTTNHLTSVVSYRSWTTYKTHALLPSSVVAVSFSCCYKMPPKLKLPYWPQKDTEAYQTWEDNLIHAVHDWAENNSDESRIYTPVTSILVRFASASTKSAQFILGPQRTYTRYIAPETIEPSSTSFT